MKYVLAMLIMLCSSSIVMADTPKVCYDCRPVIRYEMVPVQKKVEPVKEAVKAVENVVKQTTKRVRKLVGYKKVCNGGVCSMQPVYKWVLVPVPAETKVEKSSSPVLRYYYPRYNYYYRNRCFGGNCR